MLSDKNRSFPHKLIQNIDGKKIYIIDAGLTFNYSIEVRELQQPKLLTENDRIEKQAEMSQACHTVLE